MLTDIAQTITDCKERSVAHSYGDIGEGRLFYPPPRLDNLVVRQFVDVLRVGVIVGVDSWGNVLGCFVDKEVLMQIEEV